MFNFEPSDLMLEIDKSNFQRQMPSKLRSRNHETLLFSVSWNGTFNVKRWLICYLCPLRAE